MFSVYGALWSPVEPQGSLGGPLDTHRGLGDPASRAPCGPTGPSQGPNIYTNSRSTAIGRLLLVFPNSHVAISGLSPCSAG